MNRSSRMLPRTVGALVVLGALSGFVGCTDSTGVARPVSPSSIIIIGGRAVVFNAPLRSIGNPNDRSLASVEGHLQLKLGGSAVTEYVIDWKLDPAVVEREGSRLSGGGIYMIQDSEDFPNPEDVALVALLPPEDPLGRAGTLQGSVRVSAELVERLVRDPGTFTAVFFVVGGGAIAGTLQR